MSPNDIALLAADETLGSKIGQLDSHRTQIETLFAYTEEIERAIAADLEYPALALALAMPDICVSLESSSGRTNGVAYAAWCERLHVVSGKAGSEEKISFMSGDDIWALRCAFLHNGKSDLGKRSQADTDVLRRFKLTRTALSPGGGMVRVRDHNEGSIASSAESICRDIVRAVREWINLNAANPNVQCNLETLLNLDRN